MKIIHRYIFGELIKIFILSTLFLTLILFVDKTLFLTDMIINRGVTLPEVLLMMLYISPAFLSVTIPISVLLAVVIAFNQFSTDNEFVVMKASGWSFLYLMRPVMVFAILAYVFTNSVVLYFLPWGNQSFKKLVFNIVETRANINIKPQVFNRDFKDLVLFVKNKSSENLLHGIFISDKSSPDSPKIILAEKGFITTDPVAYKIRLRLENGSIHEKRIDKADYQILNFDGYDLALDLPGPGELKEELVTHPREMAVQTLWQDIQEKKRKNWPTNVEEVELSKKFSIPITCLLFALVGAPLGIKSSRTGKSGGFVTAVLIILIYYVLLVSMSNLGITGQIPPLFSVWIPDILLLIIAIYVVYKTQRELPFGFIDWMFATFKLNAFFHK